MILEANKNYYHSKVLVKSIWRTTGNDPIVKVSLLVTCMLVFVYNSAKVGKCYKVNLIPYSTL